MAEPYLKRLAQLISSLTIPIPDDVSLACKHFFSGAALYVNGKICAPLAPAGFGLKLPSKIRARLLESSEGQELRYFKIAPIKKDYMLLSPVILQEEQKLSTFLAQSIAFVVEKKDPK